MLDPVRSRCWETALISNCSSRASIRITKWRDLTAAASFTVSAPTIAKVEARSCIRWANGDTQIIATVGSLTAAVNCSVKSIEVPSPMSFKNEVLMALTKNGCNMGACHGSPSGKGGFRLSLRAYDPELDIMTLRSEFFARRTNVLEPASSLLLRKPLMEVAHGGGKRIRKTDPSYKILEGWIAEGMKLDAAGTADLVKIETLPGAARASRARRHSSRLWFSATFSDGSDTGFDGPLADFSTSSRIRRLRQRQRPCHQEWPW